MLPLLLLLLLLLFRWCSVLPVLRIHRKDVLMEDEGSLILCFCFSEMSLGRGGSHGDSS